MEGCVRPVKRECVPGSESQLNGGSDDPPQTSHRHRRHCLCRHHRLLGHNGSEAARGGRGARTSYCGAGALRLRRRSREELVFHYVRWRGGSVRDQGKRQENHHNGHRADKRRKLRFIGAVTVGHAVQHVRTPFRQPAGRATLFGAAVPGLAVMAMAFARDGTLYAVGDCNPNANFECTRGSDANYNSLYTVNEATGAFTRVGPTGAAQFFMDLAFDREGRLFGVTSTVNPSSVPAILYRIDPATGAATTIVHLVGSNSVMGLVFGRKGQLYASDFAPNPRLYRIDIETGLETAIAALPFGFSSGLELANPRELLQ